MNKLLSSSVLITTVLLASPVFNNQKVHAHCQVPCGIYNDNARVKEMLEDVATIEKACSMIAELSAKTDAQSQNQLIRWVTNKEKHAQNIISIISDYFLTQRVKTSQDDYTERLKKHHAVIVAAMKAKQNSSSEYTEALKQAVEALQQYYPEEHKH